MKEPMFRGVLVAICGVLLCGVALSQEPIPEKGPIPDDRGFQPTNPDRVAKVKMVVRHIAGQASVIAGAGGNKKNVFGYQVHIRLLALKHLSQLDRNFGRISFFIFANDLGAIERGHARGSTG